MLLHHYPCKDCTDRKTGCHDTCEKYKETQAKNAHASSVRREFLRETTIDIARMYKSQN